MPSGESRFPVLHTSTKGMQYVLALPSHEMQLSAAAWYKHSCTSQQHTAYSKTLYLHKVCMLLCLIIANAQLLLRLTAFLLLLSGALSGRRPCKFPCSPPKHCQNLSSCTYALLGNLRWLDAMMLFCLARLPQYAAQSSLHAHSICDLLNACLDLIVSLASSDLQPSCRHWTCTGPSRHGIWNVSSSIGRWLSGRSSLNFTCCSCPNI